MQTIAELPKFIKSLTDYSAIQKNRHHQPPDGREEGNRMDFLNGLLHNNRGYFIHLLVAMLL